MTHTIYDLYGEIWGKGCPEFDEALLQSLNPRSSETLYELFGNMGVAPGDRVLDVGCRDASVAVELVRRFGCRMVAIDPIPLRMAAAARCLSEAGLRGHITLHPRPTADSP